MNTKALLLSVALTSVVAVAQAEHHDKKADAPKAAAADQGKCEGANACKGNGCGADGKQGKNSCKGHGWIKSTKADCDTAKGKWSKI